MFNDIKLEKSNHYRTSLGFQQKTTYAVLRRQVGLSPGHRLGVSRDQSLKEAPYFIEQGYILPDEVIITSGECQLSLNLGKATEDHYANDMKVQYHMSYRRGGGNAVNRFFGTIETSVGSINSLYENQPVQTQYEFDHPKEMSDKGDLMEISRAVVTIAQLQFMTGKMKLNEFDHDEQMNVASLSALMRHIAELFAFINPTAEFNIQDSVETAFGDSVTISRLRMDPTGRKPVVVWSSPKWVEGGPDIGVVVMQGRYTFDQRLNSFLELYPRHPKLQYTPNMMERDTVAIPKMRDLLKAAIAARDKIVSQLKS